ncbi:MAG TPA: hypothetical protein VK525_12160 [Candidatus Saccharimonadales bacterium]|nr:hypothetical protein [Candidatus Saccharimonadales bacterium]
MKTLGRFLAAAAFLAAIVVGASADTLELKDGRIVQGKFLGGTQVIVRFQVGGDVQTFRVGDIVAVTFTGRSGADAAPPPPPPPDNGYPAQPQNPPPDAAPAPAPDTAPPPQRMAAAPPAAAGGPITVPAGQSLLVRMIDGVDSKKNNVGDVFHASLETDLNVNGVLVARKGTDIYGRLANAKEAGHISGSSELQLELTRIVVNGQDYPLVSSDYTLEGKGRGADTAKKVGVGAIAGAIIGGIAGGGKGAAIGAGAGSAAGAGVQVLTKGQQVKVPSETLLEFRLQQPVTVTPAQQ